MIKDLGTVGSVSTMTKHSLITPQFKAKYGSLHAFEFQYEPCGRNSDFCASTWPGVIALPGYKVRLEPCGRYSNSIWAAGPTPHHGMAIRDVPKHGYTFFINGATDSVSDPLVLNYPVGNPTN